MSPRRTSTRNEDDAQAVAEVRTVDTMVKYLKIFLGVSIASAATLIGIGYKAATIDGKISDLSMGQQRGDSVRDVMLLNQRRGDSIRMEMFMRIVNADTSRAALQREVSLLHDQIKELQFILTPSQRRQLKWPESSRGPDP